jgi:hypothetical protein
MTSQSPPRPVGIERLLELLNASDGLVSRDASPPDTVTPTTEESLPEAALNAESTETFEGMTSDVSGVDVPAGNADLEVRQGAVDIEAHLEIIDEIENRFAAHVVRGMSKSKTR